LVFGSQPFYVFIDALCLIVIHAPLRARLVGPDILERNARRVREVIPISRNATGLLRPADQPNFVEFIEPVQERILCEVFASQSTVFLVKV